MKKTLGLILSVLICGTMLTACKTVEKDAEETTTTAATTTAAETTAAETTTGSETSAVADAAVVDKFGEAYKALADGKDVDIKESLSFAFASEISASKSIYMDAVATTAETGEMKLKVAMDDKDIAMIMESDGATYSIYIADMKYTAYDSSSMTAQSMTLDQESYESMGVSDIFSSMNLGSLNDATGTIKSYETEVDGEKYTFEVNEATAFYYVYDKDGKIVTCSSTDGSTSNSTVINEFSTEIPAGFFDQPTGYTITDLDALVTSDALSETAAETTAAE